jgi:hypothetical protein
MRATAAVLMYNMDPELSGELTAHDRRTPGLAGVAGPQFRKHQGLQRYGTMDREIGRLQ